MKNKIITFTLLLILMSSAKIHAENNAFEITKIYKNADSICAVEFLYQNSRELNSPYMIISSYNDSSMSSVKIIPLNTDDIYDGVNEVSADNFPFSSDEKIQVFIWDSLSSQTPLTDGFSPEPITEPAHVTSASEDWTVSPDGKSLYTYNGSETNVTIPNYLNGKHITSVGKDVTTEILSQNLNIFKGKSVDSINISEGIENINTCAFCVGTKAQGNLALPSTLKHIGMGAFAQASGFEGDLIIPDGVYAIDDGAFGLTDFNGKLILPPTLKTIGKSAFYSCSGFSGNLVLPDSLEYLGSTSFLKCSGFTGLKISGKLTKIDDFTFSQCSGFSGNLTIPDSVVEIGNFAFQACSRFNGTLKLPANLKFIGDGAFNQCAGFSGGVLEFPDSVSTIGGSYKTNTNTGYGCHVFYYFGKFSEYSIPDTALFFKTENGVLFNKTGTRLLAYPINKTDEVYKIPDGVLQLDEMSFTKNSFLKTLILPDSFVLNYDIPVNVLNHDGHNLAVALYQYTSVENIEVNSSNQNYCTDNGILYNKNKTALLYIPNKNSNGQTINIPDGVTQIADGAVYAASSAPLAWDKLYIPPSVESIGEYTLGFFNNYPGKIIIDSANPYYTKNINGKIVSK